MHYCENGDGWGGRGVPGRHTCAGKLSSGFSVMSQCALFRGLSKRWANLLRRAKRSIFFSGCMWKWEHLADSSYSGLLSCGANFKGFGLVSCPIDSGQPIHRVTVTSVACPLTGRLEMRSNYFAFSGPPGGGADLCCVVCVVPSCDAGICNVRSGKRRIMLHGGNDGT